jgi:hypothetical protein
MKLFFTALLALAFYLYTPCKTAAQTPAPWGTDFQLASDTVGNRWILRTDVVQTKTGFSNRQDGNPYQTKEQALQAANALSRELIKQMAQVNQIIDELNRPEQPKAPAETPKQPVADAPKKKDESPAKETGKQ